MKMIASTYAIQNSKVQNNNDNITDDGGLLRPDLWSISLHHAVHQLLLESAPDILESQISYFVRKRMQEGCSLTVFKNPEEPSKRKVVPSFKDHKANHGSTQANRMESILRYTCQKPIGSNRDHHTSDFLQACSRKPHQGPMTHGQHLKFQMSTQGSEINANWESRNDLRSRPHVSGFLIHTIKAYRSHRHRNMSASPDVCLHDVRIEKMPTTRSRYRMLQPHMILYNDRRRRFPRLLMRVF